MRLVYTLTIDAPDELDAELLAEVEADAEPHDADLAAKLRRYLGGELVRAESAIADELPEGFAVTIDEAEGD